MKLIPLCIDTETTLIGANGTPVPDIICASFAQRVNGKILSALYGNGDDLEGALLSVIEDPRYLIIGHNLGAFDCGVIVKAFPSLLVPMLKAAEEGRLDDTMLRQKLMMLSAYGGIDTFYAPDGSKVKPRYNLATLETKYLGIDRSSQKKGDDIWRLRYNELDGYKAEDYPDEARDYALEDAEYCLQVWEQQEIRCQTDDRYSSATSTFQTESAFLMDLITATGMEVDPENVELMAVEVERLRGPDSPAYKTLISTGVMSPTLPERPQVTWKVAGKKVKNAELPPLPLIPEEGQGYQVCGDDTVYVPTFTRTKDGEVKMVAAKASKKNTKVMKGFAVAAWNKTFAEEEIPVTPTGEPSVTAEVRGMIKEACPVMAALDEYEELSKIATTQIPSMRLAVEQGGRMFFGFDVLKETSRVSSYDAGKINRQRVYPSASGQVVPKKIGACDPRKTYKAGKGKAIAASDYDSMELACFGQVTFEMLGYSDHMDRYNAGDDLHAYFASHELMEDASTDEHVLEFQLAAKGMDAQEAYELFKTLENCGQLGQDFYDLRRGHAKPKTLGFPGGIGKATMAGIANAQGMDVTEEQMKHSQQLHRKAFREMKPYFKRIQQNVDPFNVDQRGANLLQYTSHLGMIRRGCRFTQAANGKGMQTPGAECIKLAIRMIMRECLDASMGSVLFGCRLLNMIHDELLLETTTDKSKWAAQAARLSELMVLAARIILKDVHVTSEAYLMYVWNKKAKPVYDKDGTLIVWQPEKAAETETETIQC